MTDNFADEDEIRFLLRTPFIDVHIGGPNFRGMGLLGSIRELVRKLQPYTDEFNQTFAMS